MSGIITKQNAKDKAFISGGHKSSVTTPTVTTPEVTVINLDSVNVQALNNIKRAFTLQAPKSK